MNKVMDDDSQSSIFRKESLERLSSPEQLDQLMQVVNAKSWLSLSALGALVGLAVLWSIFGRIPIAISGKGVFVHPTQTDPNLVGLTYFERGQGEQIQPGMAIVLVPDGGRGGIVGRVKAVSVSPVTTLEAARQTGAKAVQPGSVEVLVDLGDADSYRWTSAGSHPTIAPGMTTTARITLAQKAPIAFAFPFLEEVR